MITIDIPPGTYGTPPRRGFRWHIEWGKIRGDRDLGSLAASESPSGLFILAQGVE
jgi:hypothetical protein